MIHPDTQVQYLDIKVGEPRYRSIKELFQEYAYFATKDLEYKDGSSISSIDFRDLNVKITDLYGWTDLIQVSKIRIGNNGMDYKWFDLLTANKQIMVTKDELVPCYQVEDVHTGFHGEVKIRYVLKNPRMIRATDSLRIHNGEKPDGIPSEFNTVEVIELIPSKSINPEFGYFIKTRSKFYNGNDIHLYGSDEIDMDEITKWYK